MATETRVGTVSGNWMADASGTPAGTVQTINGPGGAAALALTGNTFPPAR